ncbi:MAG TPA: DUF4386 domain-containing protein [Thermoanaerobaculia bacterium]
MINTIDESQRKAATIAGFTGLFTMAIAIFAYYGLASRLVVAGNAAETFRNIAANETLFRVVIACNLAYGAGVVVFLTALYVILRPVNPGVALLGALFRLVYALMFIVSAVNSLAVLRLSSGADYLRVFETDRLQALATLYRGANFDAYYVGLPFYGLASMVCAYLWFKSSYIPGALAGFGVIASAWCAVSAFAFLISPEFGRAVNLYSLDSPMGAFEMATGLWLLFKGLRPPRNAESR